MVESHDEHIMEITNEIGLNLMGENVLDEDDDDDENDDDRGDAAAPLAAAPSPITVPPATAREVIVIEEEDPVEMVLEQEGPVTHGVILADVEPEPPQPCLYNLLMRDYEESPTRMMDVPHELDDPPEADYNVDEWYLEGDSNGQD
jgi:hypothetical protein